ncbi:MAG: hypothetical protein IJV82_04750, partial [Oscillospiraceae bacterium]|nr:hypothetical protein [Oscillospiraceae bacterium]
MMKSYRSLLAMLLAVMLLLSACADSNGGKPATEATQPSQTGATEAPTTENTTPSSTESTEPSDTEGTEPSATESTEPSVTQGTEPSATEETEPSFTEPVNEDSYAVQELIARADFIAAGYDYDKAIAMIRESGYLEEVPSLSQRIEDYTIAKNKLRRYASPETITHIFFHSLIVDTDRAFDGDYEEGGYNMYMTTVAEFKAILQQMYDRGYVLISPYQMAYENENGKFVYGDIMLPPGK